MSLTARQLEAQHMIAGDATHNLLFGGSRSGKTRLFVRSIVRRAIKAPGSRHAIVRFRQNHAVASIAMDTLPSVLAEDFADTPHTVDKSKWIFSIQGGSEIWVAGLDDKERSEKVLGQEFATILLNEISQIPWSSREIAVTRLAQKVDQIVEGVKRPLRPRMYYDCNPPSKAHWSHRLFIEKRDPETKLPLANPGDYAAMKMNPQDNVENLAEGYLQSLQELSGRARRRFFEGEFGDATPGALFAESDIDKWRVTDGRLPDFVRVIIAVDPSGASDAEVESNDAIGIVVSALGTDGNGYLLEDLTLRAGPATWGNVVATAYDRRAADRIVAEANFGGDMVRHVIQTAHPRAVFGKVTASRGKVVRAEPLSSLVEQGKIRHVGYFPELEEELMGFGTAGYTGSGSPNRADAWVWAFTELFGGMVREKVEPKKQRRVVYGGNRQHAWLGS